MASASGNCSAAARPRATSVEPEGEASVLGPPEQAVLLECNGKPVGGGAAETGRPGQLRQCELVVGDGVQHEERLVEDADAAYSWFHHVRIVSQYMRLRSTIPCTPAGQCPNPRARLPRRSGTATSSDRPTANPTSCTSTSPRPRSHVTPGLRRPSHGTTRRAPARVDGGDRGPQRSDGGHRPADRRSGVTCPRSSTSGRTRPSSRWSTTPWVRPVRASSTWSGRSRDSPRPGMTIVCGDSHTAPQALRGARLRDRHLRGRACARHPDASPGVTKTLSVTVDGELRPGVTPKDVILAILGVLGHRRRHRPRRRVPGQGVPRHVDGGSDDRLQHVDRGGRQGRA